MRRTARTAALAAAVFAAVVVMGCIRGGRSAGDGALASPESLKAATCEDQTLLLFEYFLYEEAVGRMSDCPRAATTGVKLLENEIARLMSSPMSEAAHPLFQLPIGKKPDEKLPAMPMDIFYPELPSSEPVKRVVLYRRALSAFSYGNFRFCLEMLRDAGGGAPLEDYRLHLAALALFRLGEYETAAATAAKLRESHPDSVFAADAAVIQAGSRHALGDKGKAMEILEEAAMSAASVSAKGRILTAEAGLHASAGRVNETFETVMRIVNADAAPGEDDSHADALWTAANGLKWENAAPEYSEAAASYYLAAERPYRAKTILERATKKSTTPRQRLLLGMALLETGRAKDARAKFDAVLKTTDDPEILREARLNIARSLRDRGKTAEAAQAYLEAWRKRPEGGNVPLNELAWMFIRTDDETRAAEAMRAHAESYPKAKDSDMFLRLLARAAYLDGRYDEAAARYTRLVEDIPASPLVPMALFWIGKIHADRGETDAAMRAFARIVEGWPYSYYYYRVKNGETDPAPWAGHSRDYGETLGALNASAELRNGYALAAAGLSDHAEREFHTAERRFPQEASIGLAALFRRVGKITKSTKTLEKIVETDPRWYGRVMASRATRELLFPTLYADEARAAAAGYGVETEKIFAVIRQESRFEKYARSSSNALGLMQIIPSTGAWSAGKMGLAGFRTEKLYEPAYNVNMGTWYLNEMTRKFDSSLPQALAAYNWGPGSVARWRKNHPAADIDVFIESIPRAETRRYVGNCLLNYYVYKSILAGG